MSHWTIGKKLYLGVGALVALVLVISGISLWSSSSIFGRFERTAKATARKHALALDRHVLPDPLFRCLQEIGGRFITAVRQ